MSEIVLHKAASRGNADHGWLKSRHTFSFAGYYNPARMHFGALRVLNDDHVAPGMGFGTHPHDNMEIISIPLQGVLEHKDSMGNTAIIQEGDIQVMSAGTGVQHSEFNHSKTEPVKFLQIWVFPNKKNATPRYDQISLNPEDRKNNFQQIVSPHQGEPGVWIHQNAWFYLAAPDKDVTLNYILKNPGNGVYLFVLSGDVLVNDTALSARDGLGLTGLEQLQLTATSQNAEVLLMEVPV